MNLYRKLKELKIIAEKENNIILIEEIKLILSNVESLYKNKMQKKLKKDIAKIQSFLNEKKIKNSIEQLEEFKKNIEKLNIKTFTKEMEPLILNTENLIDDMIVFKIEEKISQAKELINIGKFDKAINIYKDQLDYCDLFYNIEKKREIRKTIKNLIEDSIFAKIKSIILDLGMKFARLEIQEIAEKCKEKDDLIIEIVKEMIKKREIYAEYFTSSKAVAFDLQANIDEIDKLMEAYKEWEGKKVGKK